MVSANKQNLVDNFRQDDVNDEEDNAESASSPRSNGSEEATTSMANDFYRNANSKSEVFATQRV